MPELKYSEETFREMYEALKGIRDYLVEYRRVVNETSNWPVLNKMNEALAKAKA